ncbi:fimbrial protein [Serratia ureilytica]|uniref:fimbrial protein n=1 Tax=Serratia ureilytica TaxID=300181 RepID=UPI0018D62F30|nr:fimbrial protein [Serratia ureilytica]MBH3150830.1 fimbrial protein [Serratia marcescens]MBJ2088462.1 fimbrial protein [Serratia ureilytica]HEI9795678.1 fimbrial protein [Serratia marcescens]
MLEWKTHRCCLGILFIAAFLGYGRRVAALECHLDTEGGITEETENIGILTVPVDLPIGSRLWTSKAMSRGVVCWAGNNVKGEWVHLYGNPVGDVVRPGIGMGLIYNGADLGIVQPGDKVQTDMYRKKKKPEKGIVNFQIYLEKTGDIASGGDDAVAVFQLDGKGGINSTPGKNYRYILQGLGAIQISTCSVSIDAPRELDFGTVSSTGGAGVIATKTLTVTAVKSDACSANDQLAVDLVFSSPMGGLVENNSAMDMDNGSYFSLSNAGGRVIFDTPVLFWQNIQSGDSHQVSYQAELSAQRPLQMGNASKSIVVYVNYS